MGALPEMFARITSTDLVLTSCFSSKDIIWDFPMLQKEAMLTATKQVRLPFTDYSDLRCVVPNEAILRCGYEGMMGYSTFDDEGPSMCFNPAKSSQLSWYNEKEMILDDVVGYGVFSGVLVGIDDYDSAGEDEYVMIKLTNGDENIFVGFNRNIGINLGTREAKNQVTIHEQTGDNTTSSLVAKLDTGGSYEIKNYQGSDTSVFIQVLSIDTRASVKIFPNTCAQDSDCVDYALDCVIGMCSEEGFCSYDKSNCLAFEMIIQSDNYPWENNWQVQDDCDDDKRVVLSGGPYDVKGKMYHSTAYLDASRYTITVYDTHGRYPCSAFLVFSQKEKVC